MPIAAEVLNSQLVTFEVHTGVYQDIHRRIAIVVRVTREGQVAYLSLTKECVIELLVDNKEKFKLEHPFELYRYPVLRAVRKYAGYVRKENIRITEEARKVINSILVRN